MDLATHQRKLLGLIRRDDGPGDRDEPYFQLVARSRDLREARRNVFLWRIYVLERTCPLTFVLLRECGLLADAVSEFIAQHNISPFRETQAPAFLASMAMHPDSLVALVARFERALLMVRRGDPHTYELDWQVEPSAVLYRLARGEAIDNAVEGTYRIVVSGDLPNKFEIFQVPQDGLSVAIPIDHA